MSIRKVIRDTIKEVRRNTWLIFIFSLMFVISLLALFLAPTPTYVSLGGAFLRVGSIPEMSFMDYIVVIGAYLISLFIFADAVTNINLIIKSNRTLTKIPAETFNGIFKYGLKIFFIYTIAVLLSFSVNVATFDSPFHDIIYSLFSFMVFLAIFFVPPAIVVDEIETFRAIIVSIKMLATKWPLVVVWALVGVFVLSLVELVLFALLPLSIAKYLIILVNGLLIIPVLTILQTQLYLEKYPLAP